MVARQRADFYKLTIFEMKVTCQQAKGPKTLSISTLFNGPNINQNDYQVSTLLP
jgi:hypothetical protein